MFNTEYGVYIMVPGRCRSVIVRAVKMLSRRWVDGTDGVVRRTSNAKLGLCGLPARADRDSFSTTLDSQSNATQGSLDGIVCIALQNLSSTAMLR